MQINANSGQCLTGFLQKVNCHKAMRYGISIPSWCIFINDEAMNNHFFLIHIHECQARMAVTEWERSSCWLHMHASSLWETRYNVTSSLIGWSHTQNDPCWRHWRGWVGLWGFLWWAPSAKRKDHHALDGAVFDIAQILAYVVHNMSRSQLYLGFGWLPSFFGQ